MAKQRYINTFFWDDPYIEDLCPHGKLLFIYLITTPLTNIAGSFEITVKKMCDHTGVGRDEIDALLRQFEVDGKFVYRRPWMLAVNAIEHQNINNNQIRTGIMTIIDNSPQWVKDALADKSYMTHQDSSHLNLNSNLNLISKNGETPVAAVAAVDVWKDGIELLKTAKMTEAQARPFLGRLAQQYSAAELHTAIAVALEEKPAEAKAFLIGVLKKRAGDKGRMEVGRYVPDPDAPPPRTPDCSACGDTRVKYVKAADKGTERIDCPQCSEVAATV